MIFFLVLPIEEISLQPELSSPSHFWFQGGWSEREESPEKDEGQKSLCLI